MTLSARSEHANVQGVFLSLVALFLPVTLCVVLVCSGPLVGAVCRKALSTTSYPRTQIKLLG